MALLETGPGSPQFRAGSNPYQLESEQAYSPVLRGIGVGVVGATLYATHRTMLATVPEYAPTLHSWAKAFEDKTPFHFGRTFGLSDRLSSYMTPERLSYTPSLLRDHEGNLNADAQAFQRQFDSAGIKFDVDSQVTNDAPLVFEGRRRAGSSYMQLVDREGINFETRFVHADGRLAAAARDYLAPLHPVTIEKSNHPNFFHRQRENFAAIRKSQSINNASSWKYDVGSGKLTSLEATYSPFHSRSFGGADVGADAVNIFRGIRSRIGVEGIEAFRRPQHLFGQVGFGLRRGSWNKVAHLPFVGEGGMINQMLTRRVLPVALGVTALGWLDYKFGHPSDKLLDLGLKASVLRADLTDMTPGGRGVTDFYDKVVPGPQYGPVALPFAGAFVGGLLHYGKVLSGSFNGKDDLRKAAALWHPDFKALRAWTAEGKKLLSTEGLQQIWKSLGTPGKGAAIGLATMLPFLPGMFGSRKTGNDLRDVYSGVEPVPVKSGRWWEVGSTPYEGTRIKAWRPHWSVLHKSHSEDISIYGSEKEKWSHNPILHPIRYLRDPYWLEKQHAADRPYPVASPAFSNVPLVGPLLAATIGKLVKPPVRMHEQEWDGSDYTLYSTRLEPRGSRGAAPPKPEDEFSLKEAFKKELHIGAEYTGLYGYGAMSAWNAIFPDYNKGKDVFFQGSRQMDSLSRRYYQRELGAGMAPSPGLNEMLGYTEPLRRFVQREEFQPQANEIANTMPSWMPGNDYFTNFKVGDPFTKVDDGYARLPGAGYAALHPELKETSPEDYPAIYKMSILADIAPYSREYNSARQNVLGASKENTALRIEYDRIVDRVQKTRDSGIKMDDRRFTAPVEEIAGTVESASPYGVTLKEYPGRTLKFSTVGLSAADMAARILGEQNDLTREAVGKEVDIRRENLSQYISKTLAEGTRIRAVVPKGSTQSAENISAVILAGGDNLNQDLIDRGFGRYREDLGGGEARAMHGILGRTFGSVAEGVSFQGDSGSLNPMRLVPTPFHTKFWQERTPLANYMTEEVYGTRMRRWDRPIHDFLMPYLRGTAHRYDGRVIIPKDVQERRDLNTLSDMMTYLRDLNDQGKETYTSKAQRTNIGANLFASPIFVASTLPSRESRYFREFVSETDSDKRDQILSVASPEMSKALEAQWAMQRSRIAEAEGKAAPVGENGRPYDQDKLEQYEKAKTDLDYANWLRSKEIADFFSRSGFALPEQNSEAYDPALDYQDVQLKIIQQEGYDAHDFNIFDDRASLLWRKPYVDGAVRELTSGEDRTPEQLRQAVEKMMLAAGDNRPDVRTAVHAGHQNHSNVRVIADIDQTEDLLDRIRRDPDQYRDT